MLGLVVPVSPVFMMVLVTTCMVGQNYTPKGAKAKRIRIKTEITYSFDKKKILEGKPI